MSSGWDCTILGNYLPKSRFIKTTKDTKAAQRAQRMIFCNYLPGSPRASAIKDAAKACPCSAGRQACIRRLKPTLHYLQTIQGR
jgi:hypothetical protein